MAFSEQKVNITCNSLTSYPYPDYNFYRAFLLVYLDFFVILEKIWNTWKNLAKDEWLSIVSFIDLYLVFPTNFRIVFLPHTNNVILMEPYCGTITEPGRLLCPHRKMGTNEKILAVPEIPMLQFSPIPIDAHIYQFTTP